MATAASLAVSFFFSQTILPIVNDALAGNHAPTLDQLGLAATLAFGRLATIVSVIPGALDWFMGLFGHLVFTLALPAPNPILLLSAFSALYGSFGPGHNWLTLDSGSAYHDISSSFPRFMPTRIYASAPPFTTMSGDWVSSSRGKGHPLYNSPSAEPTGFNELAHWLDPGMTRLEEFVTDAFYPLAAAFVLVNMAILLSAMADRFDVSVSGKGTFFWLALLTVIVVPNRLVDASRKPGTS